jgi:hypothetical protein
MPTSSIKKKDNATYERNTMSASLSRENILMLIDKGVDTIVLESLDDGVGNIEVCLVVLATDWLHTCPMHSYYIQR